MTPADLRALMATAERQPGETTEQLRARASAEGTLTSWRAWLPALLDHLAPVCSACGGSEFLRKGSHWHPAPICKPCFLVWYDGTVEDRTDPASVGKASLAAKAEGKWPWDMPEFLPIAPASQAGTRAPAAVRPDPAGAHSSEVSQ